MRCAAAGMPVSCSSPIARWRASAGVTGRWAKMVSLNLRPPVYSGFSEGSGALKKAADAAPANVAQLALAELVDALALQQDLARDDAARRLQQADDGRAGERLAGA